MKVLHVIDILNNGGAEKVLVNLTALLHKHDVDVHVMVFDKRGTIMTLLDKGISVIDLNRRSKFSLRTLYRANKACESYDIVHVHMRHCYSYIRLAQIIFNGKYKLLLHDHYGDINIDTSVPVKLKYFFKPKYYIGVSEKLTAWATKCLRVSEKNVFLLKNIIIPNLNKSIFTHNPDRILVISNIRPTKNIEFAIEISKRLNLPLDIYGNVADRKYYALLQRLIADEKDIEIKHDLKDISSIDRKYSIAIHTAKSETGPLVLIEYMAYGIPFIAYKTGQVATTVSAMLPDNFVDSFNKEEWIKRIHTIRADQTMSIKLKSVFSETFSEADYIHQCINIYKRIRS